MTRPVRCAHCDACRRDVTLWSQIIDLGRAVVCCDGSR